MTRNFEDSVASVHLRGAVYQVIAQPTRRDPEYYVVSYSLEDPVTRHAEHKFELAEHHASVPFALYGIADHYFTVELLIGPEVVRYPHPIPDADLEGPF